MTQKIFAAPSLSLLLALSLVSPTLAITSQVFAKESTGKEKPKTAAPQSGVKNSISSTATGEMPTTNERYENLELFQKVLNFVETNYVDGTKNKDLMYGAIKGMLETLDPHSNFLPPEIWKDMKIDTSGKFGGLGIEIGMKENVLTVIAPIEDTPAWKAGIKPNDRIVKINGESTKGMTLVEAVAKMRGKNGADVVLTIYRDGFDKIKDIAVKRETIKVQSVKSEIVEPQFGYVRLASFNENAASDMKKAIDKLEKDGKLKGLVFDLRTNPGGLLDQAVDVSSLFIDEGVVVSTIGRNRDQKEVRYAKKGMARKELPLAILVNSSSASAAEIVAGALQDHHRAIIMGAPTFGKGSVQTVVELGPDLGLKLTIARYYTPSGKSIQEKGVQPDILLDDFDSKLLAEARRKAEVFRERDLKGHMVNPDGDVAGDLSTAPKVPGKESSKEYKKEELEALGKKKEKVEKLDEDLAPQKFVAKDDYQVREAVNYLKSFEIYKKIANSQAPAAVQATAAAQAPAARGVAQ
ncbi:MAG: PDZ domain-containing protein [Methylotenera sp.]|nr:PDZ domain-containing protein [Oligoflexia bacterium]